MHLEKNRATSKEDVFFVMSITKRLTTATVLMRIDRGELALTTTVAEIIPEFGIILTWVDCPHPPLLRVGDPSRL